MIMSTAFSRATWLFIKQANDNLKEEYVIIKTEFKTFVQTSKLWIAYTTILQKKQLHYISLQGNRTREFALYVWHCWK